MFIKKIIKNNGSIAVCIVESTRKGKQVTQKVIRSFGKHKDDKEIELVVEAAENVLIEMKRSKSPVFDFVEEKEFFKTKKQKIKESSESPIEIANLRHKGKLKEGVEDITLMIYRSY